MQCEKRLYGISGIAFYRVGKAARLRKRVQPVNLQQGLAGRDLGLGVALQL